MKETKVWIFGLVAGLLMTMGLIAALDAYVMSIHASAPRTVIEFEAVTVRGERPQPQPSPLAETEAKKPAAL